MPHMEGIFINGEKAKFHPEDILDTNASQYTEEIGTATKEWLSENLTPESAGVVDKTLSIEGAAADAKETGNRISELKSDIDRTIAALNEAVESAQQAIEDMSVSAESLPEGSEATVTKTESGGIVHLDFGIPVGATGASGVYIGDTEPTDEGINVWIDISDDDKSSPIVGVGQADYMKI